MSQYVIAKKQFYPSNSPYTKEQVSENTLFRHFSEPPKHFDPARAYSSDEYAFIAQIYEPPYQYHYLLRPYKLEPLTAENDIQVEYLDFNNNKIKQDDLNSKKVSYSLYTIKIKPGIKFQPHPALVKYNNKYIYHNLERSIIDNLDSLNDLSYQNLEDGYTNTRELEANDFLYQIKRLADPIAQSPIFGHMKQYIVGFTELNKRLEEKRATSSQTEKSPEFIDFSKFDIEGLKLLDKYTYQIKIHGNYPQFKYWLAMPFFAPIPWEALKFYYQEGLNQQNISLDTYPIGTGPYYLTENNPNRKMVLEKNPYYKHGFYPIEGMPEDTSKGLLEKSGQQLPFINKVVFHLEKESIPIWNKFLQGYYDSAGISSDNFDQAIEIVNSKLALSEEMTDKNISLIKTVEPSIFYWGFNMLDPVVGGYSESNRKLRQAISIVFDVEEYVNIFRNGRGTIAHSPIPPGLMDIDNEQDFNKYVYQSKLVKKNLDTAKKLLAEAGYPNGIDSKTGDPLVINYDAVSSGNPSDGAFFNWMREQFDKLNIKLNIRATQYNRFRNKMSAGMAQMFMWGWNADYPDPENFLFLFLCEQGRVNHNGENSANYCNKKYDELFQQMQSTTESANKQVIIQQMIEMLRYDSPWIFGVYNELFVLKHGWMQPSKPLAVGNNNLKYLSLDPKSRLDSQIRWNKPMLWPMAVIIILLLLAVIPVVMSYYNKIHRPRPRI